MNSKALCLLEAAKGLPSTAVVVEIGCARTPVEVASDGWSTVYLAHAAAVIGWEFHSVDIDAGAISLAQAAAGELAVTFHHSDGETFLADFPSEIDLLYLDGEASPDEALAQYSAAKLPARARVVVDDCQPINQHPNGKATLLLAALRTDGFDVEVHDTEPGYRMLVATR